jgi:hypothetical protein
LAVFNYFIGDSTVQKQTLQQNIFKKGKQRFRVAGLPEVVITQRGTIDVSVEAVELPDGTKVTNGRVEPGEFTVTLHFTDDVSRNIYCDWFEEAVDKGLAGVNPNYKRNAEIEFLRNFTGKPGQYAESGDDLQSAFADLEGVWCTKYTIPDADIDAAEACMLECTISYDDARMITRAASRGVAVGDLQNQNRFNRMTGRAGIV